MTYEWVKSLHVIAVIAWMAGMLYLPRLFVYHASATPGSEPSETFKVMERRLLKAIMTPAMVASWLFGLWLAFGFVGFSGNAWLHAKLAAVVALSGIHGFLAGCVRTFAADQNRRSPKFYRILNEIPTILLVAVVVLVVVKPF